jgi:hypothetical protein
VDLSAVKESAIFLFNPLPWKRKALVEYYIADPDFWGSPRITHLSSKEGAKIPVQWRPSASMVTIFPRLSAWVELPPCGYKVLELSHGEPPAPESYKDFFSVSDSGFGISSLKAEDGTELLTGSVGLVAIADSSDTWAHGIDRFRREIGRPTLVSSTVIENGPVTRVTRQRARWQDSEIVLDIAQFAGLDFVELRFVIDWHEKEQMLKLEIPTTLTQPRIFAKVPGQVLERRTNGNEEPYQDWAAVQGKIGNADYTMALLNNSTYSYDCLNGLFRTVLIRSAPFARDDSANVPHNDNNAWQDQGRQERTVGRVGGFSEAIAVHNAAAERGIPVWCGGMLETGIGRSHNIALSSLPNFSLPGDVSASSRYWADDIIEPAVTVSAKGEITVPTTVGRGFEVRRDRIEALTVRRQTLNAKARVTA